MAQIFCLFLFKNIIMFNFVILVVTKKVGQLNCSPPLLLLLLDLGSKNQ